MDAEIDKEKTCRSIFFLFYGSIMKVFWLELFHLISTIQDFETKVKIFHSRRNHHFIINEVFSNIFTSIDKLDKSITTQACSQTKKETEIVIGFLNLICYLEEEKMVSDMVLDRWPENSNNYEFRLLRCYFYANLWWARLFCTQKCFFGKKMPLKSLLEGHTFCTCWTWLT